MAEKNLLQPGNEWIIAVMIIVALLILAFVFVFLVIPSIPT